MYSASSDTGSNRALMSMSRYLAIQPLACPGDPIRAGLTEFFYSLVRPNIMRFVILLIFYSLLLACASGPTYVPDGKATQLLTDCTVSKAEMIGKPAIHLSDEQRKDVLEATTLWAEEAGYFPCNFEMCAALYDAQKDAIWVYVSYSDTDEIVIGPEARIKLSLPRFRLMDVELWHSGCRRPRSGLSGRADR